MFQKKKNRNSDLSGAKLFSTNDISKNQGIYVPKRWYFIWFQQSRKWILSSIIFTSSATTISIKIQWMGRKRLKIHIRHTHVRIFICLEASHREEKKHSFLSAYVLEISDYHVIWLYALRSYIKLNDATYMSLTLFL